MKSVEQFLRYVAKKKAEKNKKILYTKKKVFCWKRKTVIRNLKKFQIIARSSDRN